MIHYLLILMALSAGFANADTLEERLEQLETKVAKLEACKPNSCISKVDGFVTTSVYWAKRDERIDAWKTSSIRFNKSYDFEILKEFADSRGNQMLAIRINSVHCGSHVIFKRDAVLLP